MIRRPPRSTRTDTLFPYTTLFRSFADEVATQLQHEFGIREDAGTPGERAAQRLAYRPDVERLVAGEVRDAEASPHVDDRRRRRRVRRKLRDEIDGFRLRLDYRLGRKVLGPGEDVETAEIGAVPGDRGEQARHLVGVYAERLRAAPHPHAGCLEVARRVDAKRDDRKSTRMQSSHYCATSMPSSACKKT